MNRFHFWQRWLLVVGVLITIFGLILAFFNPSPYFDLLNDQINPVFWGAGPVPEGSQNFQSWVYGVLGATVTGWGIFLTHLAYYPFRKQERWAWNAIASGMIVWFVVDSAISYSSGVTFNVIFNTFLLVLVLLPLLFTYRYFR